MKNKLLHTGRVAFAVLILVLAIIGYIYYEKTIVAWWIPVVAATIIAVITLPLYKSWYWLVGKDSFMELLCHIYVVGCTSYGLLLISNSIFADNSSYREETVHVVSKEQTTRRTGYRSGRHYRTTGRVTKSYYVTVCFADSTTKELPVSRTKYYNTHKDRPWPLTMKRGLYGFWVIN